MKYRVTAVLFFVVVVGTSIIFFGSTTTLGATSVVASPNVMVTGNTAEPIFEAENLGTGPGLEGISVRGKGVIGQTKFNSTQFSNRSAGVVGQDLSRTGSFNSGVRGTSTVGSGVSGSSVDGNGMVGDTSFVSSSENNKTAGVLGEDLTNGTYDFNAGVLGTSNQGDAGVYGVGIQAGGVFGTTEFASLSFGGLGAGAVLGEDLSTDGGHGDFGAGGSSTIGTGVLGESQSFVSAEGVPPDSRYWINDGNGGYLQTGVIGAGLFGVAAFGLGSSSSNYPALYVQSFNGSLLIRAAGTNGEVMSLDNAGNMILKGSMTQHGNPFIEHTISPGKQVGAFQAQTTSASIEDFGSGSLVDGVGYVRLDPTFVSTIDHASTYLVFITPDGPNHGLYVSEKSLNGFSVRENPGGRSTLTFDYRIVAKPLDSDGRYLPVSTAPKSRRNAGSRISMKARHLRI